MLCVCSWLLGMCVCVCVCEAECVCPLLTERINHQGGSQFPFNLEVKQGNVLRDMFYSPTSQFIFTSPLPWCVCVSCGSDGPSTAHCLLLRTSALNTAVQTGMLLRLKNSSSTGLSNWNIENWSAKREEGCSITLWKSDGQESKPTGTEFWVL